MGEDDLVREWLLSEEVMDETEDVCPWRMMEGWEEEVVETAEVEVKVDDDDSDPRGESGRSERGGRGGPEEGVGGVRKVVGVGRGEEGRAKTEVGGRIATACEGRGVVAGMADGAAQSVLSVSESQRKENRERSVYALAGEKTRPAGGEGEAGGAREGR